MMLRGLTLPDPLSEVNAVRGSGDVNGHLFLPVRHTAAHDALSAEASLLIGMASAGLAEP
jgi:hypothetical protein